MTKPELDTGTTPLFIAAQKGHAEVARLLLEAGVNYDKARTGTGTITLVHCSSGRAILMLCACCLRLEWTMTKLELTLEQHPCSLQL